MNPYPTTGPYSIRKRSSSSDHRAAMLYSSAVPGNARRISAPYSEPSSDAGFGRKPATAGEGETPVKPLPDIPAFDGQRKPAKAPEPERVSATYRISLSYFTSL